MHIQPRTSAAAPSAGSAESARDRLIKNVDLVLVPATVVDERNQVVLGLHKDDFSLLDDGRPQEIRSFYTEDAPLSLGIVFDTSKSMSDKISEVREALKTFLATANTEDDFFMIAVTDRPVLLSGYTAVPERIESKLIDADPHGRTALLDAIYMAMAKLTEARYPRRALLILSDGGDNHSRFTPREIRELVQESNVQVYAIGVFDSFFRTPEEARGKHLLEQITAATGGRTFAVRNARDLPEVAGEVSRELRSQYMLGFRLPEESRSTRWHELRITVRPPAAGRSLHVYTRSGYYGPAH